jgi:hypothetical protein
MLTRQKGNDGLGVFLNGSGKALRFDHNGRDEGFDAWLLAYAETGQGAAIMINANDNSRTVSEIMEAIARAYHWPEYPVFTRPRQPIFKLEPKTLEAYTGRYCFVSGNHQMLTFVKERGQLYTQVDGFRDEEFAPATSTDFLSQEQEAQISFATDADGAVSGLVLKAGKREQKAARVGPLVHSLTPQSDPDPAVTQQMEAVLRALAQGGKAEEEVAGLAPGARRDFSHGPVADFAGMRFLSFIALQDVSGRGIAWHGGKVSRILYYKLVTDKTTRFVLVCLTADGLLTDFWVVDD